MAKGDSVNEIITDRIVQSLTKGIVPWRMPWSPTSMPMSLQSKKPYRGINVFLLNMMGYASPWWVTINQCNEKGGRILKGESPSLVVWRGKVKSKEINPRTGDHDFFWGKPKWFKVWNVLQCEGLTYPKTETHTTFDPIPECEKIVEGWAGKPPIVHGGNRACYSPSEDRISMPVRESFEKVEEYYSTLFHEMVHSTGHKDRLAREGITNPIKFASHDYSFEELVAECGATFLCGHAGVLDRTFDNSAAYISNWVSKLRSEPEWVISAGAKAQKAYDLILGVKWDEKSDKADEAA
jgi:antirestriction protein ArdC